MLPPGAVCKVINHATVKQVKVIQAFRYGAAPCKSARQGDVIVGVVKKVSGVKSSTLRSKKHLNHIVVSRVGGGGEFKKGDLIRAVVVRTKKEQERAIGLAPPSESLSPRKSRRTGNFISFPGENSVVVLGHNGQESTTNQIGSKEFRSYMKTKGFSYAI